VFAPIAVSKVFDPEQIVAEADEIMGDVVNVTTTNAEFVHVLVAPITL
jgi:hypothetical protein